MLAPIRVFCIWVFQHARAAGPPAGAGAAAVGGEPARAPRRRRAVRADLSAAQADPPVNPGLLDPDHARDPRVAQVEDSGQAHPGRVEPGQQAVGDPHRAQRGIDEPGLLGKAAVVTDQRLVNGGAHQVKPSGDQRAAQPDRGNVAGIGLSRAEQQGADHLRPDDTLRPPARAYPRVIVGRIAAAQVNPRTAGEGLPEQAFRLSQVAWCHGDNLGHKRRKCPAKT